MRAFVLDNYGAPLRAASIPEPRPAANEVLVRMVASGVNHADERLRAGEFKALYRPQLPKVMGGELSGEVIALGSDVTGFSVGDHVYGYTGLLAMGSFAEVVAVDAAALAPAPASVSLVEAAALPVVALTAWDALVDLGHVQPGQRVLVHGGAGGVGAVAVQLARHLGATVVATASADSAGFVRELGADTVIDYRNQDFVAELAGQPVDLVLDTQGGDIATRSLQVLRRGGLLVSISGVPDPQLADQAHANTVVKLALGAMSLRLRLAARRRGVGYRFLLIEPDGATLTTITGLVDTGVLRSRIDRILPFDETPEALHQLLTDRTRGKVLVATDAREATA